MEAARELPFEDGWVEQGARRERTRVRLATALLLAFTLAAILVGLYTSASARDEFSPQLLLWALVAFVGGLASISLGPDRPTLSMDLPVLLACAFVVGPIPAASVALISAVDRVELRRGISLSRALWNHAQVSLSVMAAGFAFTATGGQLGSWPTVAFCAVVALLADSFVNYFSVSLILSLATGRSFGEVLRSLRVGKPVPFFLAYAGLGVTGLLMAEAYGSASFLGVLAFLAPVLLARDAFRKTLSEDEARRDLAARREALRRVDERIAEEREDERARIAAALHDEVLQSLYNVTIRAQVIRECYRTGRLLDLEADVPQMVLSAERAVEEVRDLIQGLKRSRIGHAGLVDTLALLVAHLHDQSGMTFVAELDTSLRALPEQELLVYQVAREALTNAVKHSGADTVWVSLHRVGESVVLSVLDNGIGYDSGRARDDRHFGLELMQDRVAIARGHLEIRSQPGTGVRIEADFPLRPNSKA